MEPMPDRIWAKFEMGPGCWEWTGARTEKGYGRVWFGGKVRRAHRVVYEQLKGPIPEGLELDHLCGNPPCVRASHLEPVDHTENVRRGKALIHPDEGAECPKCGTEMVKHADRRYPRGWAWRCRPCAADYHRRRRARKRTEARHG